LALAEYAQWTAGEKYRDVLHAATTRSPLSPTSGSDRSVSSYNQLAYFPDTWKIVSGKFMIKIKQVIFEIVEVVTLRPMIWIGV
jgi:hypothetical protein